MRQSNGQRVILKHLFQEYPSAEETARFQREYHLLQQGAGPGILVAYDLLPYEHSWVMVLEDFGGQSLSQHFEKKTIHIPLFLSLTIRMTEILSRVHQQGILHKDLNPANFIWNAETDALKLIDFGIASQRVWQKQESGPDLLEGTVAYLAPEQSGQMNR